MINTDSSKKKKRKLAKRNLTSVYKQTSLEKALEDLEQRENDNIFDLKSVEKTSLKVTTQGTQTQTKM